MLIPRPKAAHISRPKTAHAIMLALILLCASFPFTTATRAQRQPERTYKPDVRRALASRTVEHQANLPNARRNGYLPQRNKRMLPSRPSRAAQTDASSAETTLAQEPGRGRASASAARVTTRSKPDASTPASTSEQPAALAALPRIGAGTPLSRVLHTAQLSNLGSEGSHEQYVDRNRDLVADERTTFDARLGSYDIAVGRSGAHYEVFTGIDDLGTTNTRDDIPFGVLTLALDTNGDFVRDSSSTYDLERDFRLPSAVSVVSGVSANNREFVVVSSSGYYNSRNLSDPNNEPSAGVVLLVRDAFTGGFDATRSRELVRVGSNQLNNANALALLPTNDLLIADFDSNELRIVRDTDGDRVPDMLDPVPYYSYRYSNDAPLDVAVNSRGVVFSHSFGNDAVLLAVYDDNGDGRADTDEVCVEGLSLDNNLILHGLTVERDGTVYLIEDASGAADATADGGNLGEPRIDAFPDPALNGILRDGSVFASADLPARQSLTGLAFGVETAFASVGRLKLVNGASLRSPATRDGLAAVTGTGLTLGASGRTPAEASAHGLRVTIEGRRAEVLSFSDMQVNIHVPAGVTLGVNSVVVYLNGTVIAADDAAIALANPGLFTAAQTGAGEIIALLVSGNRYTPAPFPARFDAQGSVVALFGTGWRNSLPVSVSIGGRPATVQYAGQSGGFPGLDQINVLIPEGATGAVPVVVTTANGAASRSDAVISIR